MVKCDECGILFHPMTDAYICPNCGAENEPIDLERCDHPRLNMEGICFKCGEDCRGAS